MNDDPTIKDVTVAVFSLEVALFVGWCVFLWVLVGKMTH